ncbi:hypothetical protein KAU11_00255 [Candidatus Babeliales bacterium]|nr:hypothetical protein [Candidatus Babeliales bacterium]
MIIHNSILMGLKTFDSVEAARQEMEALFDALDKETEDKTDVEDDYRKWCK